MSDDQRSPDDDANDRVRDGREAFAWFKPKAIDYRELARAERDAKVRNAAIVVAFLALALTFSGNIAGLIGLTGESARTPPVSATPSASVEALQRKVEAALRKPRLASPAVAAAVPVSAASAFGPVVSEAEIRRLRLSQRTKMAGYANAPAASPQPSQAASPLPSPAASPQPSPAASPQPSPAASPLPSPAASPQPSPAASPQPSPAASPQPSPRPSPAARGAANLPRARPRAVSVAALPASARAPVMLESYTNDFTYAGRWERVTGQTDGRRGGQSHRSFSSDARAVLTFTGTAVQLFGVTGSKGGLASVRIDGEPATIVSFRSPRKRVRSIVYERRGLADAEHTLRISVAPASPKGYVNIEGAAVTREAR